MIISIACRHWTRQSINIHSSGDDNSTQLKNATQCGISTYQLTNNGMYWYKTKIEIEMEKVSKWKKNIRQKWVFGWINLFVCKSYIHSLIWCAVFFSCWYTVKHWTICKIWERMVPLMVCLGSGIKFIFWKYMQTFVHLAITFVNNNEHNGRVWREKKGWRRAMLKPWNWYDSNRNNKKTPKTKKKISFAVH